MKFLENYILLLTAVSAHYTFPRISVNNGQPSRNWQYSRHPLSPWGTPDMTAYYVDNPYHLDIRCNRNTTSKSFFNRDTIETLTVNAGDKLGVSTDNETFTNIVHPGPGLFYLARAPDGIDLKDWDGDGNWFKIGELGLRDGPKKEWAVRSLVDTMMNVTIPETTPPGKYLLRAEHIYPQHSIAGTEFFISCTHLEIQGPGGGTPGPAVKFPGAYDDWDRALWAPLRISLGWNLEGYTPPGPKLWTG